MIALSTVATIPEAGALEASADTIGNRGRDVESTAEDCKSQWAGMCVAYNAPEQDLVHGAMDSVVMISAGVAAGTSAVTRALNMYATELAMLATRRAVLIEDIIAHNSNPESILPDPIEEAARVETAQEAAAGLVARVNAFNAAALQSDADCAADLARLPTHASSLLATAVMGEMGGAVIGVSADLFERYRTFFVPGENFRVPKDIRTDTNLTFYSGQWWAMVGNERWRVARQAGHLAAP